MTRKFAVLFAVLTVLFTLGGILGVPRSCATPRLAILDVPKDFYSIHLIPSPIEEHPVLMSWQQHTYAISGDGRYCFVAFDFQDEATRQPMYLVAVFDTAASKYTDVCTFPPQNDDKVHRCKHPRIDVSPDDKHVAVGLADAVWLADFESKSGRLKPRWQASAWDGPRPEQGYWSASTFVKFSDDGKRLYVAVAPVALLEYDVHTGKRLHRIDHGKKLPKDLQHAAFPSWALFEQAGYIVAALDNKWLFGEESNPAIKEWQTLCVTRFHDGSQKLLDLATLRENWIPVPLSLTICRDPTCPIVAITGSGNCKSPVYFLDLHALNVLKPTFQDQVNDFTYAVFSPDGKWLLLAVDSSARAHDPDLVILETTRWQICARYRILEIRNPSLRFSHDGQVLALYSEDHVLAKVNWPRLQEHFISRSKQPHR